MVLIRKRFFLIKINVAIVILVIVVVVFFLLFFCSCSVSQSGNTEDDTSSGSFGASSNDISTGWQQSYTPIFPIFS